MAEQIIICLDGFVMLPIECLEDVKNLKISTAIKPTNQEIIKNIMKEDSNINKTRDLIIKLG